VDDRPWRKRSTTASSSSTTKGQVVNKRAWIIAVLLPVVYALFGFTWMSFVPVLPELMAMWSIDKATALPMITIISMVKGVVPIVTGIVAARIGVTTAMRLAGILIVVGGVAPWLSNHHAALVLRAVFGVGGAMWVTLMGPVVLAQLSSSQRPVANAVNGIAVNMGVVLAMAFTLDMVSMWGVPWAMSVGTLATLLCLVVLFGVGPLGTSPAPEPFAATVRAYVTTLKLPATWLLAVAFCGPLALYLVLNTFLATHLQAQFGIARPDSMRWLSYLNLWGVPGSVGAGLLLTKIFPHPRPFLVAAAVLAPLAVYGATVAPNDAWRAFCFALLGIAMFLPVSPLVTTLQRLPGQTPASLGMIFGTMFAVTYLVSAAVPTLLARAVEGGIPLASALGWAGLLGLTPLAGTWLIRPQRG
jgi:predicted MFS family arabinose efflux permease